jgi:hypothetical protein
MRGFGMRGRVTAAAGMDVAGVVVVVSAAEPAPASSSHDDVALDPWVTAVVNTAAPAAVGDTSRKGELG